MSTTPQIDAIPAFSDNYIWLVHGPRNRCAVVDPGDAAPVLKVLEEAAEPLRLAEILSRVNGSNKNPN